MSTGGGRTEVEKRKQENFSPEHTIHFILTSLITQREVQWGTPAKEPGEDKRPKSRWRERLPTRIHKGAR